MTTKKTIATDELDVIATAGAVSDIIAVAQEAAQAESRVIIIGEGDLARHYVLLKSENNSGIPSEKLVDVTPLQVMPVMSRPGRVVATPTLGDQASFIAYLNAFKGPTSAIFVDHKADTFTAILDYHGANEGGGAPAPTGRGAKAAIESSEPAPRLVGHAGHVATLKLERTEEFKAWEGMSGKLFAQLELVRFLEENREDILTPDTATLLEACRDLQALKSADFRSIVREDSENYRIEFKSSAELAPVGAHLPAEFVLSLPIYFGGDSVSLAALLRWKIGEDNDRKILTLGFKLKRVERVRQAVLLDIGRVIAEATGLPLYTGKA